MKKINLGLIRTIFLVPMLMLALAFQVNASELSGKAPDFTLQSRAGSALKLSDYKGQVVMMNFWASWCAPCRQEMPLLEDLHKKYEALGFTVLGVNIDENSNDALSLLKETPVTFPIAFDNKNSVAELFNVTAMPSTVMIDRHGNQRYLHKGYKPGYEANYEKHIRALVRE